MARERVLAFMIADLGRWIKEQERNLEGIDRSLADLEGLNQRKMDLTTEIEDAKVELRRLQDQLPARGV